MGVEYTPDYKLEMSLTSALMGAIKSVWLFRFFVVQMSCDKIRAMYTKSAFGFVWQLVMPLVGPSVYVALYFVGVFSGDTEMPRLLYVIGGFYFWNAFCSSLLAAMGCPAVSGEIAAKSNVPLVPVYMYTLIVSSVDLIPQAVFTVLLICLMDVGVTWGLAVFPLLTLLLIMAGAGVGILLSIFVVFFEDIKHVVNIVLRYAMFASAVVWPIPKKGVIGELLYYNPLIYLVDVSRDIVVFFQADNVICLVGILSVGVIVFFWGIAKIFQMQERLYVAIGA